MSTSRQNWAIDMANAHIKKQPKPNLTEKLSLAAAYEIQALMLGELSSQIVGFKGALSAKPAQDMFGVESPLLGVLLENAECQSGFSLEEMALPMLEVEVGLVVGRRIDSPICESDWAQYSDGDDSAKAGVFSEAIITIELAEVAYQARPSAQDLVAGNSAAGRFIRGPSLPLTQLNDLSVELWCSADDGDRELVNQGATGEMGSQYELAIDLLNQAIALNYPIEAGTLVMTGSLGKIIPAKPGNYETTFSLSSLDSRSPSSLHRPISFSFQLGV